MQISAIVATYNRRALLARSLPTVLEQDLAKTDYEVVAVVDGSTDGTAEYLRNLNPQCNLRVIEQPNRGQAAAINAGLQAARGEIVLFLDDDILCSPGLFRAHLAAHRADPGRLVYGPVLLAAESPPGLAREWARTFCDDFFARLTADKEEEGWYHCLGSANSSAERALLLASGGLDESFARGNDFEFGLRLSRSGRRFRYEPAAVVHQLFTKTVAEIVRDARDEGRANIRLCRKFPERRQFALPNGLHAGPLWKRWAIRLALWAPCSLEPLLRPFTWTAERLRRISFFRGRGLQLLDARRALESLRGAVETAGSRQALLREFGVRLPALMYHNIGEAVPGGNPALTISTREFRRHLRWLSRHGYQGITASQWLGWCRQGTPVPEKPVLLTFDDAYAATARNALPILRQEGFTATVFVVSSEIGGSNTWDQANGIAKQKLMTEEEIVYWAGQGIEFGAHSRTHADLTTLSASDLTAELLASRERLHGLLNAPVVSFAYPYGYYDDRVVQCAQQIFAMGFTCDPGLNRRQTDLLRLKRADMTPFHGFADPLFQALIGYNPLIVWRRKFGLWRRRLVARAAACLQG